MNINARGAPRFEEHFKDRVVRPPTRLSRDPVGILQCFALSILAVNYIILIDAYNKKFVTFIIIKQ
jgi:hypothetical protein